MDPFMKKRRALTQTNGDADSNDEDELPEDFGLVSTTTL